MKKKYINYIVLLVFLLAVILLLSWFYVRGAEIDGIKDVDSTCTVTVLTYQHMKYDDRIEYTLDPEQIGALQELLKSGRFTKVLGSFVTFEDQDMYDILIDFNNGQDFISIHCIGNEYLNVTNQFGDRHLKIHTGDFESQLCAILSGANQ